MVNDNDAPVEGARIAVRPAEAAPYAPIVLSSDTSGAFTFTVPSAGDYLPHRVDLQRARRKH